MNVMSGSTCKPGVGTRQRMLAIMRSLSQGDDITSSLEAVCAFVEAELTGEAVFRASILRLDDSGRLRSACSPSLPAAYLDAIECVPAHEGMGSCGTACARNELVISECIADDPKWAGFQSVTRTYGLAACWSHPVRDHTGKVTACLGVYVDRPLRPSQGQVDLLAEAAEIAGLAISRYRAERENAATIERLDLMLEGNKDGVWDWDVSTGAVYFNPRWETMLGYAPGEVEPHVRSWEKVVHPEDMAEVMRALTDHLEGRSDFYETEHRCLTKAGDWIWILDRGKVVARDAEGRPVRAVGTHTDITERKEQERQLRHNKARYKAIINTAADAIITMGEDRRIVDANPATATLFGWPVAELIGQPVETIMPVADRQAHVAHVKRYVDGGPPRIIGTSGRRLEGCRRDGSTFPISLSITQWNVDGERHFTGIIRDISRQVASEEKLRASEAEARKLAMVADKTTNAVIITDAAGRIEWVNKGFERVCGFTAEEALGQKPGDLLQGVDTDPAEIRRISSCLAAGTGFRAELINYTKAGDPYWVDIDCEPVTGHNGTVEHFIAIERDITEHRRLTERLLRAEQVAKLGNWVLEVATMRLSWSDEIFRILEMPLDSGEPTLEEVLACYHPADRDDVRQMLDRAVATGEPIQYRRRLLINDAVKWVDIRCEGERDATGAIVRVFGICQNVTAAMTREAELIRARDQADAANRAKSEFLATMSHELRTPLNAILGYTEIMAGEMFAPLGHDRYRGYAQDILTSGRYLLTMIENVLDLSRMEADRVHPEIRDVALAEVVDTALTLITPLAQASDIHLSHDGVSPDATVQADPSLLQQVLVNVLDNAVKFTPKAGRVDLATTHHSGTWRLSVTDTGIGIAAEHIDQVVKPFYRVQNGDGTRAGAGGTGIGLALSDRFIHAMDGSIDIASTPNEGTTVTVALPTADTPCLSKAAGA